MASNWDLFITCPLTNILSVLRTTVQIVCHLFPKSHLQSYRLIPTKEQYLNQMPTYLWLSRVLTNGRRAQGPSHHLIYVRCLTSSKSGYGQCPDNSSS